MEKKKTILLSAALSLVGADERIVCIEEVPEIAPAQWALQQKT